MRTIGFAGTFYTLWDVNAERVDIELGVWYNKVQCTYLRNLSKNLDDAISKAGTSSVDKTLAGKRKSFTYNQTPELNPSIMTDREILFRIILVNRVENTHEARIEALNRMIELKYIEINCDGVYEIQGEVRYDDIWYHDQLKIEIKGII